MAPRLSGGDHQPAWSAEVRGLLKKLLSSKPPSSYSACASELHRRLDFQTDRASVRRWAIENKLAPDTRYKTPPKPVKRWQARDYGALWQYDASPHAWLPGNPDKQALLDILDDATRYNTGARLYPSETLLAHFDFLTRVFKTHGLPLAPNVRPLRRPRVPSSFAAYARMVTSITSATPQIQKPNPWSSSMSRSSKSFRFCSHTLFRF